MAFCFFGAEPLALATLARIADITPALADSAADDAFYTRTDLSLDYYRMIRRHQRDLFEARPYARAITAFGLGLIPTTGSRRLKRQSDLGRDRDASLRSIRAIPHNAILQQLGYPVNVLAGLGTAATGAQEGLGALLSGSARGRQILALVGGQQCDRQHQDAGRLWRIVQQRLLGDPPLSRHRNVAGQALLGAGRTAGGG